MPAEYNWVLVCRKAIGTGEPTYISIATYREGEWQFDCTEFKPPQLGYSGTSYYSDLRNILDWDEITHWAKLPETPND
jgi:hypothetical protein